MNVGKKLLEDLEQEIRLSRIVPSSLSIIRIDALVGKLRDWMDRHEKMFDHSVFVGDQAQIDEWLEYHDAVMNTKLVEYYHEHRNLGI